MTAAARLLSRLIRERDELLNAARLDAKEPLPAFDGPKDAGSLYRTRVAELVSSWGRLGERERLHRDALAELAPTNLYATLAPILGDAMAAHQDLIDALGDGRPLGLERYGKALAALQSHLPAVGAALTGRIGEQRPAPTSIARLGRKTEARDKWLYDRCCRGEPYKYIIAELRKRAHKSGWAVIGTVPGIRAVAIRYAGRHNLPPLPRRRGD